MVAEHITLTSLRHKMSGRTVDIVNTYFPPQWLAILQRLHGRGGVQHRGKANIMCADMSWRPTAAGAVQLRPDHEQLPLLPRWHAS